MRTIDLAYLTKKFSDYQTSFNRQNSNSDIKLRLAVCQNEEDTDYSVLIEFKTDINRAEVISKKFVGLSVPLFKSFTKSPDEACFKKVMSHVASEHHKFKAKREQLLKTEASINNEFNI